MSGHYQFPSALVLVWFIISILLPRVCFCIAALYLVMDEIPFYLFSSRVFFLSVMTKISFLNAWTLYPF